MNMSPPFKVIGVITIVVHLLFVLTFLSNHVRGAGRIYPGVPSSCESSRTFDQLTSNVHATWCQHQNSFASRQRFISDVEFFSLPTSGQPYLCGSTSAQQSLQRRSEGGTSNDQCRSIIAIRTSSSTTIQSPNDQSSPNVTPQLLQDSYLAMALITGEIVLYNSRLKTPYFLRSQLPSDAQQILFDMKTMTAMASVVHDQTKHQYYLETFCYKGDTREGNNDPNIPIVRRRYDFNESVVAVPDMRVVSMGDSTLLSINLVQLATPTKSTRIKTSQIQFFSFGNELEKIATWTINYERFKHHGKVSGQPPRKEQEEELRIEPFIHWSNLGNEGPSYFDSSRFSHAKPTLFVAIYTSKLVTIVEFDDTEAADREIDLTKINKLDSIAYQVSTAESEITALSVEVDPLRRPLSLNSDTNCNNVKYQSSLGVYLNVAEYHVRTGEAKLFVLPGLQSDGTWHNIFSFGESSEDISVGGRVKSIRSAHTDVRQQLEPYNKDGYLNPRVICEAFREFPYSNTSADVSYENCVDSVSKHVKCEVNLLNQGFDSYLNSFYYLYWKASTYLAQDNNMISVVTKTPQYNSGENNGKFKLTLSNILQSPGEIHDLHVSQNDQHVFSSITRYEWEIRSMDRYSEVCDRLQTNPDNIFLKPFVTYCNSLKPKNISVADFAVTSSSCSNGWLCSSFDKPLVTRPAPGKFVYRSFLDFDCPKGFYCPGDGLMHDCPLGLVCPEAGLINPLPCSLPHLEENSGFRPLQQTCYSNNLVKEVIAPVGTWAATSVFPPILIPPGKFLLKVRTKSGEIMLAGIYDCKLGDYCGLGREVIVEEEKDPRFHYDELLCPGQTYCANSTVMEPHVCLTPGSTSMPYCPPGTIQNQKCPAGFYCPNPNEKYSCSRTQYCPEGSFLALPCTAGYYCPDPTIQVKCPKKHFCQAGSVSPVRCTFFFSHCPAGSPKDSMTASGIATIMFIIVSIGVLYGLYILYLMYHRRYGDSHRSKRKQKLEEKKNSMNKIDSSQHLLVVKIPDYQTIQKDERPRIELPKSDFALDIRFEGLGLKLRSNKQIVLQGVTGEVQHGKLTAVMGVSGAGKSSFISALAGRAYYGNVLGKIFVNGEMVDNLDKYGDRIGFVPQDDIMIRECTVEESLYFSARTRLDRKKSKTEIMDIVDNVIQVLGLGHVRHSVIGDEDKRGISGGERKRVSVGIELVAQPIILFCDEPTSGLDSAAAKEVCEALKSIAKSGITVVGVIHQPRYECFEMFDSLLLLGRSGRTVYMGPVTGVQKYFECLGYSFPTHVNPSDYLMDITSGTVLPTQRMGEIELALPVDVDNLPDIWMEFESKTKLGNESSIRQSTIQESRSEYNQTYRKAKYSLLYQFIMCFERSAIQQLRGLGSIILDSILVALTGFFVGMLFLGDKFKGPVPPEIYNQCPKELREGCKHPVSNPIVTLSNTIGMGMALCSIMASLRVFGREKTVYRKESQTGLSTVLYFWAKDLSMIPNNIIAPLIFTSIFYSLMGPKAPTIEYFYTILLTYWSCYGLGYVISIVVAPHIAQLAAVVMIFILNIFSGISPRLPMFEEMKFPLRYAPFFSPLRYSMELFYINELWTYRKIYDLSGALDTFGYQFSHHALCWGMLLVLGLSFRLLACLMLLLTKPNNPVYRQWFKVTNWGRYSKVWHSIKSTSSLIWQDLRAHFSE